MARTKKKSKGSELAAQTDPQAPLDSAAFLKAAQPVLELLTRDLLTRADASEGITAALKVRHAVEVKEKLTADAYDQWRRQIVVQIAAGWLLSCVFVRTLEDRGLLPHNRIAGPGATDAQHTFFSIAPYLTERDYLRAVFTELEHVPACKELFDREHNLTWRLAPSAEATKELLGLFRMPDAAAPGFRFGQSSTRFLGDLYQDLSEDVRKRFALLQTPDFIESFILDRTLEPAVEEFGLGDTTVIDPTCGSGHFLLGAFERLFQRWSVEEPGEPVASAVGKALESVYGVDVNPYAVSIARFRLTLAAVEKLGGAQISGKISGVPRLPLHVVVADSLLHGFAGGQGDFGELEGESVAAWKGEQFAIADEPEAKAVLKRGYAAVVGNPPYITVKDEALRERYRKMYAAANGKYALSAPFMERFFALAREGGFVGQITANSFMKREFGKGLVEKVLPAVDVELIVNTAGAYIPGHGTPTVLVFGRNRRPVSGWVQAVLARRGEPSTPEVAAEGVVWGPIRQHGGEEGFENEYVTVERVEREKLGRHPWSLEGGGAGELKAILEERCEGRLGQYVDSIGVDTITRASELLELTEATYRRIGVEPECLLPQVVGEGVRDWGATADVMIPVPYDRVAWTLQSIDRYPGLLRFLWPHRSWLAERWVAGGTRMSEKGIPYWAIPQLPVEKHTSPLSIVFPFVATHNNFVLDRGGKVFKQTAPIIKLPAAATEDDHLALLAYLNSSSACFWMKQVAQARTITTGEKILQSDPAKLAYEFTGTHLERLPVPRLARRSLLVDLAREVDGLANARLELPRRVLRQILESDDAPSRLAAAVLEDQGILARMSLLQEIIDLAVYEAFGLVRPNDHVWSQVAEAIADPTQGLPPEHRSFLSDHESESGPQWLTEYFRDEAVSSIEQPAFKRRWLGTQGRFQGAGTTMQETVLDFARDRLLERVEAVFTEPRVLSTAEIARRLQEDATALRLASLVGVRLEEWVCELPDAIPFSAAHRYAEAGIEKFRAWEATWDLERDSGDNASGSAGQVPPKYDAKDFRSSEFYRLRGKIDVPTERFISYPGLESGDTGEVILGWAGWDHGQRAQALAALYVARRDEEGWGKERLLPILVGIHEIVPWLRQWHNASQAEYGQGLGDFFADWLREECRLHSTTDQALRAWRPMKRSSARAGAEAMMDTRGG